MRRPAALSCSIVCWLIALAHLLRLVFGAEVTVGGVDVPRWASAPPVVFFGALGAWLWLERRGAGSLS